MDISTIIGALGMAVLFAVGIGTGEISTIFLNAHGIIIVFGGTVVAMLVNTPAGYLRETLGACFSLFRKDRYGSAEPLIPEITRLAESVQRDGLGALRNVSDRFAGGYLASAALTALEYNNPEFVRKVLETETNNSVDRTNEIINVIRTAGVVSPMFGLIGTLIGIIKVLQLITDPDKVAVAMAIAITSAFYGIVIANIVCIPIAGKLRMRLWEQIKIRAIVIEGVIGMMEGMVPLVLERRLQSLK